MNETSEARHVAAADLARKHGITVERAEMLVDRLGTDRHDLEGAAQALQTRKDDLSSGTDTNAKASPMTLHISPER